MAHLRKLIIDTFGSMGRSQNRCFTSSQVLTATISAKKFNRLEKLKQEEIPSFSEFLTDKHGREHNYLRISVTERCNLRCTYCMPEEGVPLTPKEKLLSTEEVVRLARLFVSQGVDKIRITGGEPLIRVDLATILENISKLNIKSIGITTNGLLLSRHLPKLLDSGLTHLNISLDSLQSKKFEKISRRPQSAWIKVWKGIEMALDSQLHCLKLNCVVMRGTNDDEIVQFVDLTKERNLDVRFIEYMPFSGNKWDLDKMVPYQEMIQLIKKKYPNMEKLEDSVNHTSKGWKIPGHIGQFGFITSMSDHFCGGCNRLRITADGNLKVCLFGNAEVSLRDTIRNGASDEELLSFIGGAVKRKHPKHAGMMNLAKMENRPMILIENQQQRQNWISSTTSPTFKFINNLSFTTNTTTTSTSSNTINSLRLFSTTSSTMTEKNIDSTNDKKKQEKALSHVDSEGQINMVDVSDKIPTLRIAEAESTVILSPLAFKAIQDNQVKKGDVLTVSKLAGIMGAKQTSNLIPLCHPLPLNRVDVQIKLNPDNYSINIRSLAKTNSNTGVEMEALMACTISSLTIYDMCKALDKSIIIKDIRLVKKTGGKSGDYSI